MKSIEIFLPIENPFGN